MSSSTDSPVADLFFEDLVVGSTYQSAGRTVTEADIVAFAGLSGDFNQIHVDRQFAETGPYGERVAHGILVLSILSGLCTRLIFMQALSANLVGLVNLECRWKAPARIGDTLVAEVTIEDLRPTSGGDRGIMVLKRDVVNQNGAIVMESIWKLLIKCREPGPRS